MTRFLLLLALIPLCAQDLPVIHFTPKEAEQLREIRRNKEFWDARWSQAEAYIRHRYTTEPGVAQAGETKVEVESFKSPWQHGVLFSRDYEVAVPKPEPPEPKPCN